MTSTSIVRDPAPRDAALAWLTGRLWWERLLTDLHGRADQPSDVVADLATAKAA